MQQTNKAHLVFNKIFTVLKIVFLTTFALSFIFTIFNVIFNKSNCNHPSLFLILIALCGIALLYLINFLVNKKVEKFYYYILGGCALFYFVIHLITINLLKFEPAWDLKAIYGSAIKWVETGTFEGLTGSNLHNDYFYIFSNNLGSMTMLAIVFKICSVFNLTNYFWVASIFNSLLICGTIVLSSLIAKNIAGKKAGIITLCCYILMPAFYFMAPVFYTDSLSIIFPVLAIYLFTLAKNKKLWLQILLYALSSIVCAIGMLIKMPVLILGIAICITLLCNKKFVNFSIYLVSLIISCSIILGGFNGYIYSKHLDKKIADTKQVSILYWVDLALHGDGYYNNETFWMASNSSENPEERIKLLKEDIKKQLKELKFIGIVKLFERKNAIFFGDGTLALSDFLDDTPLNRGSLHKNILYEGKNYEFYKVLCTGLFLSMLLCMLLCVKKAFKNKTLFIMLLSIFGIALFLLFWETNSRYITTFVPFILICASIGITSLFNALPPKKIKALFKNFKQKFISKSFCEKQENLENDIDLIQNKNTNCDITESP